MSFDGRTVLQRNSGATKISGQLYRWNAIPERGRRWRANRCQPSQLAAAVHWPILAVPGACSAIRLRILQVLRVTWSRASAAPDRSPGEVYVNAPNVQYLGLHWRRWTQPAEPGYLHRQSAPHIHRPLRKWTWERFGGQQCAKSRDLVRAFGNPEFLLLLDGEVPARCELGTIYTRRSRLPIGDLLTVWMAKLPPSPLRTESTVQRFCR